jgi:hypothetical protein
MQKHVDQKMNVFVCWSDDRNNVEVWTGRMNVKLIHLDNNIQR